MSLLTKNDIIEIQRHCYGQLQDLTVLQGGVEVTLKVGGMISDSSYFDIHKFAADIEAAVLARIKAQNDTDNPVLQQPTEA